MPFSKILTPRCPNGGNPVCTGNEVPECPDETIPLCPDGFVALCIRPDNVPAFPACVPATPHWPIREGIHKARLIDIRTEGNHPYPIYGIYCGSQLCDGSIDMDRLVDTVKVNHPDEEFLGLLGLNRRFAYPVYGFCSECCEYPVNLDEAFHAHQRFGYPISHHLRVKIVSTSSCPQLACASSTMEFKGFDGNGREYWEGSIAGFGLRMTVIEIPVPFPGELPEPFGSVEVHVTSTPPDAMSCSAGVSSTPGVRCFYPLRVSIPVVQTRFCCGNCIAFLGLEITGYCSRVKLARLVDTMKLSRSANPEALEPQPPEHFLGGEALPVYASEERCCDPPPCPREACCQSLRGCDIALNFMKISGDCDCMEGGVLLTPSPTGPFDWENLHHTSCGCQWGVQLDCVPEPDNGPTRGCARFRLLINGSNGTSFCGGQVGLTEPVGPFCDCDANPNIEFEVTIDCQGRPPGLPFGEGCCGEDPASIRYLVSVSRA